MLPSTILSAGLLATAASAFKIRAYNDDLCAGDYKEINIWDSTCRGTGDYPFTHFILEEYGARHQKGTFYQVKNVCESVGAEWASWYVGGHSDKMVKGVCYNLGFEAGAIGSRLG